MTTDNSTGRPADLTDTEVRAEVHAQRAELAAILHGLPAQAWDAPTLCSGWRVRELVAHLTMPFRSSTGQFLSQLVRSGGRFNRMSDRCARRDAATLSAADLAASLADNIGHPWTPPCGGATGALSHDLIHGLDLTTPLGIDWRVPHRRLRVVLAELTPRRLKYFGVDLDAVALRADDLDWTHGSGAPLRGAAQDLLLVMCGRTLPTGRLHGAAAPRFTSTEADA